MKWKVYFLLFLILTYPVLAEAKISIVDTVITCKGSTECDLRVKKLKDLKKQYPSLSHLATMLKLYMQDESVSFFQYQVEQLTEDNYILRGWLTLNKRVAEIDLEDVESIINVPAIHPLREGSFYDARKERKMLTNLTSLIRAQGYPNARVTVKKEVTSEGYKLTFKVKKGEPRLLDSIKIISDNPFLKEIGVRKLSEHLKQPFNLTNIKESLSGLQSTYVNYGYYPIDIKFKTSQLADGNLLLIIEVIDAKLYSFYVKGNEFFDEAYLKEKFKESMVTLKKEHDAESVISLIKDLYWSKGFRDAKVNVKMKKFKDTGGVENIHFQTSVDEGSRYKIAAVSFKGNDYFSDKKLEELFFTMGDSDISHRFHNEKYYLNFMSLLKNKYLEHGFVNVLIEKPQVNISRESKEITIDYRIREVVRSQVSAVEILGVPEEIEQNLKKIMTNKERKFFNPLVFEEDLKSIISYLRNEGYFYATIKSLNANDLVKYNQDNSLVRLKIEIDLDKKYIVNDLIIIGNYKTQSKLIKREAGFVPGQYLTERKMRNAQTNLLALGLFSRATIRPVKMGDNVDLFIEVEEKDFGLLELAPGFRTDIGLKFSSKLSYINLDGMNKQLSVSALVNRRFDLHTLDERRREEGHHIIEYEANINYSENKIFDSIVDYGVSFSSLRRRFFSFDADIERLNNTGTINFNNWFSTSLRHQLEVISQYDASLDREHGHFQIGSLTPGVTFDFRDNRINPSKGAYFNLTCEFANPYFGSQSNDELEINYYKLISRNRFYIPMGDVTFAVSASVGMQKNLATDSQEEDSEESSSGYIPNIKVFRLTGVDLVRGFEDDEINRLVTGEDISEVRVDDTAYMANLKLEPRVFISDSMMFGVFYDAGRVFVNSYDFSDLRSSAGVTFKYLTPVGSLDFDYGIKLLRKRDSDGRLESPGRLHVSIGFF